jgi:hypothetical protein
MSRRRVELNPDGKTLAGQIVIGVATSVISGVVVALVVDAIRKHREAEPLRKEEPAPGYGETRA